MKKLVFCLFVGSLILVPRLLIADACEDCLNKCNNNSYCNATDNKSKRECNRCKNAWGRAYALLVRRKACNKSNQLSQFALK